MPPFAQREWLNPPQYFGFMKRIGPTSCPVILRREWRERGQYGGTSFSERNPVGDDCDIPLDHAAVWLPEDLALECIAAIRAGRALPSEVAPWLPELS